MSVTDEIKERLDIVEVVSRYVQLKKAGHNFQGLCPFHSEKTPSFVVFPDTQSWHCFGACGTGGDIFTFIEKRERLDFAEALKLLAAQAGVELEAREGPAPAAERHLERLRELLAGIAGYYHHLLRHADEAAVARVYLERRGLAIETWEKWQLGYASDSWAAAKEYLGLSGYSLDEGLAAGLLIQRDDGSGCYDRFRGRLMIPIRDVQGRTAGFGARILREDPDHPQPKYINSPDTDLFDKGGMLFGFDMARKAIRETDLAVLVEGYMDVLMSHQVGVQNVVAGMGTALTEAQLGLLKRCSRNITLALDPDAAGMHAAMRGLQTARETLDRDWEAVIDPRGLIRQEGRLRTQLRIASLPDGLDPDELARQDRERWLRIIAEAQPLVDYYLAAASREEDLSTARGKSNLVARMAPLIGEVANPIERTHYIQHLARLIQTDERLVAAQVQAAPRDGAAVRSERGPASGRAARRGSPPGTAGGSAGPAQAAEAAAEPLRAALFGLEEHILGNLLARPELLAHVDAELIGLTNSPLAGEDFVGGENRAILAALAETAQPEGEEQLAKALDRLPQVVQERCLALVERIKRGPNLSDAKLLKELCDAALRLRRRNLDQSIRRLQFMIQECETSGADEQLQEYKALLDAYIPQVNRLQKLLYARTMVGSINKDNGTL